MRRIILLVTAAVAIAAMLALGTAGAALGQDEPAVVADSAEDKKCEEALAELAQAEASGEQKDIEKGQEKVAEYCPQEEAPVEGFVLAVPVLALAAGLAAWNRNKFAAWWERNNRP
jgi:hypothetical protein